MRRNTALCFTTLTIVITLAASAQVNIENDLIINENNIRVEEEYKPDETKPDDTAPEDTKPDGTQPDGTEPDGTKPDGTEPDGTEPDGTEPAGTEPDVTEPEENDAITTSTLSIDGITINDISATDTSPTYPTRATTKATGVPEQTDPDDVECMTEVTDGYESTVTDSGDEGNVAAPGSRSVQDGDTAEQNNIVETTLGPVQGFEWDSNADIIAYIDIPYGEFTGYFQDSSHPDKWEKIHDAKEHDKRCPQIQDDEYVGDLDCLTLSIFTPTNAENAAVLFHIHEGNFASGSGDPSIYGPEYFVKRDVILVLPNYRLGPLGFLCLRNAVAPGNGALKDLTLALSWISENIAKFGGDPSNIVVSGDGTAGALAGYLALSSKSRKYISKVITESGAVLSHWALDRNPATTAENLILNIRELTTSNITIEQADVKSIILAAKSISFRPCLEHNDHSFLSDTPWSLLHREHINITFMIGSASHAGAREALSVSDDSIEELNENFGIFLPNDLHFDSSEEKTKTGDKIRAQYFGENTIKSEHIEEMSLCYTDSWYMGPAIRTARAFVYAGATVYFYEFSFVGEQNIELESINNKVNGAVRGDIIGYLFHQDGKQPKEDSKEERMLNKLLNLWVTFIETGEPKVDEIVWNNLRITADTQEQWLSIGTSIELKRGLHINRLQLWTEIYNEHFIEHRSFALQLAPNISMTIVLLLFWFGNWKTHFCEHIVK